MASSSGAIEADREAMRREAAERRAVAARSECRVHRGASGVHGWPVVRCAHAGAAWAVMLERPDGGAQVHGLYRDGALECASRYSGPFEQSSWDYYLALLHGRRDG